MARGFRYFSTSNTIILVLILITAIAIAITIIILVLVLTILLPRASSLQHDGMAMSISRQDYFTWRGRRLSACGRVEPAFIRDVYLDTQKRIT